MTDFVHFYTPLASGSIDMFLSSNLLICIYTNKDKNEFAIG
jgi:hypothetical protein